MRKTIVAFCLILIVMLYGCSGSSSDPEKTGSPDTIDTQEAVTVPDGPGSVHDDPGSKFTTSLGETETETDIPETAAKEDHTVTEGQNTVQPPTEVTQGTHDFEGLELPIADITDSEETSDSSDGKDKQDVPSPDDTDSSQVTTSAGQDNPDTEETTSSKTNEIPWDETTRPVTDVPDTEPQDTDGSGGIKDNEASMMTDF